MEDMKYLDWEFCIENIKRIAEHIENEDLHHDCVVGIGKGGLPIAVTVADYLDLPLYNLGMHSYVGQKQGKLSVYQDIDTDLINDKSVIVIDDINDTGKTLFRARELLKCKGANHVDCYTLIGKNYSEFTQYWAPVHYEHERPWIVFPWEISS